MSEQTTTGDKTHLSINDALRQLEQAAPARSILLFAHGTLEVKFYVPRGANGEKIDPQQPHTRDEIYVVAQGSGAFFNGSDRRPCQSGDLIFAPAGNEHRFEDFTDDFTVWVIFFGPE